MSEIPTKLTEAEFEKYVDPYLSTYLSPILT